MSVSGKAMAMRLELAHLMRRHRVVSPTPIRLPLSSPSGKPIIVEGIAASATTVDHSRMLFRRFAFPLPTFSWDKMPPLRFRHGVEDVGEIEALEYDRDGSLRVRARVDHEEAQRCPAFSICAKILDFEIVKENSADFHALIKRAEIIEISVTDAPGCPAALVDDRYPVPPHREFYKNAVRGVELLKQMVTLIGDEVARATADAQKGTPASTFPLEGTDQRLHSPARPRASVEPHRTTPFGALVSAIERNHHVAS